MSETEQKPFLSRWAQRKAGKQAEVDVLEEVAQTEQVDATGETEEEAALSVLTFTKVVLLETLIFIFSFPRFFGLKCNSISFIFEECDRFIFETRFDAHLLSDISSVSLISL